MHTTTSSGTSTSPDIAAGVSRPQKPDQPSMTEESRFGDYENLCLAKEKLLRLDDLQGRDAKQPRTEILNLLYQRHETIARVILYKDFANDYTRRPEKWNDLQVDIDRYEAAKLKTLSARKDSSRSGATNELEVLRMASRLASLEDLDERLRQSRQTGKHADVEIQIAVDEAKRGLSECLALMFQDNQKTSTLPTWPPEAQNDVPQRLLPLNDVQRMAIFARLAMMIPMLIMSSVDDGVAVFISISASTVIFTLVSLATWDNLDSKDLVVALAAYPCVLTIFWAVTRGK